MAHALEALALMAERRTHTAAWASNPTRQRLRFARCCYGHLAGQLGVELLRGLPLPRLVRAPRPHGGQCPKALLAHCLQKGWLRRHDGERALEVTPLRRKHLAGLLPSINTL